MSITKASTPLTVQVSLEPRFRLTMEVVVASPLSTPVNEIAQAETHGIALLHIQYGTLEEIKEAISLLEK